MALLASRCGFVKEIFTDVPTWYLMLLQPRLSLPSIVVATVRATGTVVRVTVAETVAVIAEATATMIAVAIAALQGMLVNHVVVQEDN
jgi:hypothetical protein